jgi:hypothetical protein
VLGILSALFVVRSLLEASTAMAAIAGTIERLHDETSKVLMSKKEK